MDNIRDVVLRLHQEGYAMIPSGKGTEGKSPSVSWKAYQKKLPSEEEIRAWMRLRKPVLWGLVTGEVSQVVIVDSDPGADPTIMDGLEPHVKTPRGGSHYWFEHPGHHVKTCAGVLPGIDIRGDGGFANVVGVNPMNGGKYTIEIMPTRDSLYPWDRMPKAILEAMGEGQQPEVKTDERGELIPEGNRNSWLFRRASGYRANGDSEELIFQKVKIDYEQRCFHDPPMSDKELMACCHSAARYEPEQKAAPATLRIISARDLMEKEFPPLIFAIPGIIPEGLTLLAGKPKAGKSWLALQFAYSVALGKNLMDGSQIERGSALVLGLEDGERRLKARLGKVNSADCVLKVMRAEGGGIHIIGNIGEVPDGIDLTTTWPRIGSGGIEELEKYLDEHPDVRLVVIDTIKRFTKKKGKGTAYDEDYDSVQPLQELAMRKKIPILAVCHIRKAVSDDPLDMVSGTFGLTGGVDNILVLQREGGNEFRLSIIGRDIESHELALMFGDNCMWTLLGDADIYFVSEAREKILGCLMDFGSMMPKEIASSTGENPNTIRNLLAKMLRDGQVKKDASGKYSTTKGKGA